MPTTREYNELLMEVERLREELRKLKEESDKSCHWYMVEETRKAAGVPKWIVETSYSDEILAGLDYEGVKKFMEERARLFYGQKPRSVPEDKE